MTSLDPSRSSRSEVRLLLLPACTCWPPDKVADTSRLFAEMFRNANSTARLRLRTSSARWEGTDDLTQADIARYHRAMGFRSTSQQPGPSNNQQ